jgi:hypothetical protein
MRDRIHTVICLRLVPTSKMMYFHIYFDDKESL